MEGSLIISWLLRFQLILYNRKSVYKAFGWGDGEVQPLLGVGLRDDVARMEHRAMALYSALQNIVSTASSIAG